MACGVAASNGFFILRAMAETVATRRERHKASLGRGSVACVGKSANGMFLKPPQFRRAQGTSFVESPRSSLLIVSMCQDRSEIMAAEELADGSIFFSFEDNPKGSDLKKEVGAILSPNERLLISHVDLPKRLPSQFKKQLPYPVISGRQKTPESAPFQNLNQNYLGLIREVRHGPHRYPSSFVKKSPFLSAKTHEYPDFPESGSPFAGTSSKDHFIPSRLPSKFMKQSPICSQPHGSPVPPPGSLPQSKHPESASQENVGKVGRSFSRLHSKFVKQSPIPSSSVALPATTRKQSLTSARNNADAISPKAAELQVSKSMDLLHLKAHSRGVSSREKDQKRTLKNIQLDLSLSEVDMIANKANLGGLEGDDHLTSKGSLNIRGVNQDSLNALDELTRVDAPLLESHQSADHTCPSSDSVLVLPKSAAVRSKDVQSPHQPVLQKRSSPITCSPEPQLSHVASENKASKGASAKISKHEKYECENGNTTESSCSSISTIGCSSTTLQHSDYSQLTVAQLKMLAKSRHLKGYSKLKKQALLELLQSAEM